LQVPPPSGVHPRPSTEGEAGGREESQLIIQSLDRPKEGEEDFNSSLGPISLVGTICKKKKVRIKRLCFSLYYYCLRDCAIMYFIK